MQIWPEPTVIPGSGFYQFKVQVTIFDTKLTEKIYSNRHWTERRQLVTEWLSKWTDTNSASYKMRRSESVGILYFSFRDKMLHVKGTVVKSELKQGKNEQSQITDHIHWACFYICECNVEVSVQYETPTGSQTSVTWLHLKTHGHYSAIYCIMIRVDHPFCCLTNCLSLYINLCFFHWFYSYNQTCN